MSGHTPGPWSKGARNECANIYGPDKLIGHVVGSTRGRRVNPMHKESQANARLIAAAPDLLKSLKETIDELDCQYDSANGYGSATEKERIRLIKNARAVIKKAGGK